MQYLDKVGVAYFGQPSSSSSSEGPAAGGAGLMSLFGGGAGGGLLGKGKWVGLMGHFGN